ncbi:MAG: LVIVD repeat-containing protein [Anaerolineae bacterium]
MAWQLVLCLGLALSTTAATSLSGASRSAPAAAAPAGRMAAQADAGRALPRRIGQAGGSGAALAVRGSLAFFATGSRLRTADLRDPAQPRLLGESDELPDLLQDIVLRDDIALVAAGNAGLWLLDVSDPGAPHVLGSLDTPGMARGVAVAGDLAYVADGPTGLLVVDISHADRPRLLGMADTPGDAGDVLVRDGHAYVADWTGGLRVFNIADGRGPIEVAKLRTGGNPQQLTMQGHLLYVAQWPEWLLRVDVSIPAAPRRMENVLVKGRCIGVQGDLAYILDDDGRIGVVDVSDPADAKPLVIGAIIPGLTEPIVAVAVLEGQARLVGVGIGMYDDALIMTIDISKPSAPRLFGHARVAETPSYPVVDVAFFGHFAAVVAASPGRLKVFDLARPQAPRQVGELAIPQLSGLTSLAVEGGHAYLAHGSMLSIVGLADPTAPTLLGELGFRVLVVGVSVAEDHAFLAAHDEGLKVVDIANPKAPKEVASISGMGSVLSVGVDGTRAYVGSSNGLYSIDIEDPVNPVRRGYLALNGVMWRNLTVEDNRVFVSLAWDDGAFLLVVVDVENPAAPRAVDWIVLPVAPFHLVVKRNIAFVASDPYESGTLWRIDLAQPHSPDSVRPLRTVWQPWALAVQQDLLVTGSFSQGLEVFSLLPPPALPLPQRLWLPRLQSSHEERDTNSQLQTIGQWGGPAQALAVSGNRAYLGQGPRVQVLDLSQAGSPQWLGESPILPGVVEDLAVQDGYVYVAAGEGGLRVLDLSDARAPREVGTLDTSSPPRAVVVHGAHAYVATSLGLLVVDVSQPAQPREVARVYGLGSARALALVGDQLYMTMGAQLVVLDLSSPAAPLSLGATDRLPGEVAALVVDGGHAVLAAGSAGLLVIDVTDPSRPIQVGQLDTPGMAVDVALAPGGQAIVADQGVGLEVVDVAMPAQPRSLGGLEALPGSYRLAVAGATAYVVDRDLGLRVVDLIQPAAPRLLATLATTIQADDLAIDGTSAYAVGMYGGLAVLDLSGPGLPRVTGRLPDARARRIAVANGMAYLANGAEGLQIIDVGDPAAPRRRARIGTSGQAYAVVADGAFAYVADNDKGLTIVDVRNPDAPRIVDSVDTPGRVLDVVLAGSFALLADNWAGGLRVIDVTDPTQPREVSSLQTPGSAHAVTASGKLALVNDGDDGLRVVDISDPRAPREVAAWDPEGVSTDIQRIGDRAYVAVGDWSAPRGRLQVLSLAVPQVPRLLASLDGMGAMASVAVTGQHIFMAGQDGLWVIEEAGGGVRP